MYDKEFDTPQISIWFCWLLAVEVEHKSSQECVLCQFISSLHHADKNAQDNLFVLCKIMILLSFPCLIVNVFLTYMCRSFGSSKSDKNKLSLEYWQGRFSHPDWWLTSSLWLWDICLCSRQNGQNSSMAQSIIFYEFAWDENFSHLNKKYQWFVKNQTLCSKYSLFFSSVYRKIPFLHTEEKAIGKCIFAFSEVMNSPLKAVFPA